MSEHARAAAGEVGFRVVVLSCGPLGAAAAAHISQIRGVTDVTLVRAPYRAIYRPPLEKLSRAFRYGGYRGVVRAVWRFIRKDVSQPKLPSPGPVPDGLRVLDVADFHDPGCIEAIQRIDPDLGVIVGTYILKPDVYGIPRLGSINLHTGKTPEYRGSAPGFWEMYNGERCIGVTIHRVEPKVDSGPVLRQELIPLEPAPSGDPLEYVRRFRAEQLEPAGLRLLSGAVCDVVDGRVIETAQDNSKAHTYRMPTQRDKRELRRRVRSRRATGPRRRLKHEAGRVLFRTGAFRPMVRNKALVMLFHRVDDRYAGNPISCTVREFDQYCSFFADYFDVVSLTDLVDLMESGSDLSGKMVITFDDGYADNVDAAATLQRYGLTASFFISTDFIGTQLTGWWDASQGLRSHWMSWDDVRQLHHAGFDIGAHTRTHVDLGRVNGEAARLEIVGSKQRIETELGSTVYNFAYPYGGRNHLSRSNLEIIKQSGFRSCVSAYGGIVTTRSNRFDIHRVAVSPWHRTPWQLGFELLREPQAPPFA